MFDEWYAINNILCTPVCILKRTDTHFMQVLGGTVGSSTHFVLSTEDIVKLNGAVKMDLENKTIKSYRHYLAALYKAFASGNKLVVVPSNQFGIVIDESDELVQYAIINLRSYFNWTGDQHIGVSGNSAFINDYLAEQTGDHGFRSIGVQFAVASKTELFTRLRAKDAPIIINVEAACVSLLGTLSVSVGVPVKDVISKLKEYLNVV